MLGGAERFTKDVIFSYMEDNKCLKVQNMVFRVSDPIIGSQYWVFETFWFGMIYDFSSQRGG